MRLTILLVSVWLTRAHQESERYRSPKARKHPGATPATACRKALPRDHSMARGAGRVLVGTR